MSSNGLLNRPWLGSGFETWVLIGITLVSLIVFVFSIWPKLQVLLLATPENRFNRFWERLLHMLRVALGQSKLFKRLRPGWMHAAIFWGFCVLLLRAGQFFFIGFFPDISLTGPIVDAFWSGYLLFKDVFVVLIIAAVMFAVYRRMAIRPPYLTLSFQGLLILFLILIIMITDAVFEGAFLALHLEPPDSIVSLGFLLASTLEGIDGKVLKYLHLASYWVHIGAILIFLTLLPRSKHFHIFTSFPNVFFANLDCGNAISRIEFEDESRDQFGVVKIEDFSWKRLLDFHTCTECGRCDQVCPALKTGKPLSPKQFTVDLRDHLNAVSPAILSKSGAKRAALAGEIIPDEVLWSCTTCGACEEECPVEIEYVAKFIDLRRALTLNEDRYPGEFASAFRSLEINGNPWGFGQNRRGDWADGLEVKLWDKNNPTEYLYFVGCNGSFDDRGKKVAESVVRALQKAKVDFSILGQRETCTGDPARRAGNEYLFEMLASKNSETFQALGVVKVVTHCPHCFNSLKNEYPAFGNKLDVIHHSDLLAHLMREGKLPVEKKKVGTVVFHDSCYLGRHNGNYDTPREILDQSVEAGKFQEVENNKERGTCCGAGGARFLLEEHGSRVSHMRADELMESRPDTIAVSCPFCILMLEDALKAKNLSNEVKVRDISEMLG